MAVAAQQLIICPSHTAYSNGTYFITINSYQGTAQLRITPRIIQLPPPLTPTQVIFTHLLEYTLYLFL